MALSWNVKDKSNEVEQELKRTVTLALDAVGFQAEGNVKLLVPVDTGRLRSSITHLVDDNKVTIGTNVEYAVYVEMRDKAKHPTGQAHFLRDGINDHIGEYKVLIRHFLEG